MPASLSPLSEGLGAIPVGAIWSKAALGVLAMSPWTCPLISVGCTLRVDLLGQGLSICLVSLDFPFPEQSLSRKDLASQPQFPLHLPHVGALPQLIGLSVHCVSKFGTAPPIPATPTTCERHCAWHCADPEGAAERGANLTWSSGGSEAGKHGGPTAVSARADEHARSHGRPQGRQAHTGVSASERGWGLRQYPLASSILSPCANSPFWTAPSAVMWTSLNQFLLHPQAPC